MIEIKKLTQSDSGRAFEWAMGCSLSKLTNTLIVSNKYSELAENSYKKMNDKKKDSLIKAADIALAHILEKENVLITSSTNKKIEFNTDKAGKHGDVRDLLLYVSGKVLGISCKYNHQALKHSSCSLLWFI